MKNIFILYCLVSLCATSFADGPSDLELASFEASCTNSAKSDAEKAVSNYLYLIEKAQGNISSQLIETLDKAKPFYVMLASGSCQVKLIKNHGLKLKFSKTSVSNEKAIEIYKSVPADMFIAPHSYGVGVCELYNGTQWWDLKAPYNYIYEYCLIVSVQTDSQAIKLRKRFPKDYRYKGLPIYIEKSPIASASGN